MVSDMIAMDVVNWDLKKNMSTVNILHISFAQFVYKTLGRFKTFVLNSRK